MTQISVGVVGVVLAGSGVINGVPGIVGMGMVVVVVGILFYWLLGKATVID